MLSRWSRGVAWIGFWVPWAVGAVVLFEPNEHSRVLQAGIVWMTMAFLLWPLAAAAWAAHRWPRVWTFVVWGALSLPPALWLIDNASWGTSWPMVSARILAGAGLVACVAGTWWTIWSVTKPASQ